MKLCVVLFGLLACAIPAAPQYCGNVEVNSDMPSIIECPSRVGDVCEIKLSCLQALDAAGQDWAAIRVYFGDTIHWVSDLRDKNGHLKTFKFKGKFQPVRNSKDPDCIDPDPNGGDPAPFDDDFPGNQKSALAKNAVVSMTAPYQKCFKHVIHIDKGDDPKDGDIDPHIIIGGQPPSTLFTWDSVALSYSPGSRETGRYNRRKARPESAPK